MYNYFAEFCKTHNIKHFVMGGCCIGAVRHNGFIPWDDDLDIFLLRPDYEKLLALWPQHADTDRYSLCVTTKNYNDHHLTSTIRDNDTTFIKYETKDLDVNQGLMIDIGVIDACPESRVSQIIQLFNAMLCSLYKAQRRPNRQGRLFYYLSTVMLKVVPSPNLRYRIWSSAEKRATKYNFATTRYVKELMLFSCMKKLYRKAWFENVVYLPFEDILVPVPVGYHEYLTTLYGDYMQPPPEKERVAKHNIVFMDLDRSYRVYRGVYYHIAGGPS